MSVGCYCCGLTEVEGEKKNDIKIVCVCVCVYEWKNQVKLFISKAQFFFFF